MALFWGKLSCLISLFKEAFSILGLSLFSDFFWGLNYNQREVSGEADDI